MASRTVLLGLLCLAAALQISHAGLPKIASMLITTYAAQSDPVYLTVNVAKKTAVLSYMSQVKLDPSHLSQRWIVSTSFPSAFQMYAAAQLTKTTTLANGTKINTKYYPFLSSAGGKVGLVQYISGVTDVKSVTWNFDGWGRLSNWDKSLYLDTTLVGGYTKTLISPLLTSKTKPSTVSQQWVVQQDLQLTDPVNITGMWRSTFGIASSTTKSQLCLDAGPKEDLVMGKPNAPTLKPCNSNVESQYFVVYPPNPFLDVPDPAANQFGYYPSMFRIYSPVTGLCLAGTPPFGTGRAGSNLLQVVCDAIFADTTWWFNTRGMLESGAQTMSGNPMCINNYAGVPVLDSCSWKQMPTFTYENRLQFTF